MSPYSDILSEDSFALEVNFSNLSPTLLSASTRAIITAVIPAIPNAITVHLAFANAPTAPTDRSTPDFNFLNAEIPSPILEINVPKNPVAEPNVVPNNNALVIVMPKSVLANSSNLVPASIMPPIKSLVIVPVAKFSQAALSVSIFFCKDSMAAAFSSAAEPEDSIAVFVASTAVPKFDINAIRF